MVKQSRFMSGVETAANMAVGIGVSFAANLYFLPFFGFAVTVPDAIGISLVFTAVSIVRSYYLRRVFEFVRIRWGNFDPFKGWTAN